jgi:hypothetical protein
VSVPPCQSWGVGALCQSVSLLSLPPCQFLPISQWWGGGGHFVRLDYQWSGQFSSKFVHIVYFHVQDSVSQTLDRFPLASTLFFISSLLFFVFSLLFLLLFLPGKKSFPSSHGLSLFSPSFLPYFCSHEGTRFSLVFPTLRRSVTSIPAASAFIFSITLPLVSSLLSSLLRAEPGDVFFLAAVVANILREAFVRVMVCFAAVLAGAAVARDEACGTSWRLSSYTALLARSSAPCA